VAITVALPVFRRAGCAWLLALAAGLQLAGADDPGGFPSPGEKKLVHFDAALPHVAHPAAGVDYTFDLAAESFEIFVPRNYSDREPFGIFAFMDAADAMTLPKSWEAVLEKEKLICLIPQKIGNNQPFARRAGLTYVGLLKAAARYKADPDRIFTGGMSGGARSAVQLAFLHNDVIAGNIAICGANFYQPVPRLQATNSDMNYGVWPVPPARADEARSRVRFAFITGPKDFRHGNILDICQGGFEQHGFQSRLIDVPGLGHELCSTETLQAAFDFVGGH
jgi:hypothetical protein